MTALGLTWSGEPATPEILMRSLGRIAIVEARLPQGSSARDRLRLQVAAARAFSSFLPFAPARHVCGEAAEAWATARIDRLERTLSSLDGACEIGLDLIATRTDPPRVPREWLRHRAARLECVTRLKNALTPFARDVTACVTAQGARVVLLIDRQSRVAVERVIEEQCRILACSGWSAVLTGPWPPLSFGGETP